MPIVITGFEPLDILEGVSDDRAATRERAAPRWRTSTRARCEREGNRSAQKLVSRGLRGLRSQMARHRLDSQERLRLRNEFRDHDAERLFEVEEIDTQEPAVCISGLS